MNRVGILATVIAVFSLSAFAQVGPRDLTGGDVVEQKQGQLQQSLISLYLSDLKEKAGLNDDQFLKVEPIVRRFIQMRFRAANQRKLLEERQERLLSAPAPADSDIKQLNEDLAKSDNEAGTWSTRFMRNLQPELTELQLARTRQFHQQFINEKLPMVLERLRSENAIKNPNERPAGARANQNRKQQTQPARPNTLRGKNAEPAPVRPKLAR